MGKKLFSLCMALVLCLSLLPATALAADNDTVYVGGEALTGTASVPVYATTDDSGNVSTADATAENYNIKWDGSTLTLKNAYITNAAYGDSYLHPVVGAAIGVANSSGDAELTIQLESGNTIKDVSLGIWVYSSTTGYASLTITGDGNLTASGSSHGILVQSNSGDAALTIRNADVTAENSSYSGDGVTVRAGSSSSASLSVDGGSLTATGKNENGAGIRYTFGSSSSGSGKPSLTVSGNAIVRANGGISDNSSTNPKIGEDSSGTSGGIVFDDNEGTVYGDVTLDESLTINQGETLTIPEGSSLNCNDKLTNSGTILASGGTVTGSLSGGTEVTTPSITAHPTGKTVTEGSAVEFSITASDAQTYQWQQSTDSGSSWTAINDATGDSYTISSTTSSMNNYQYRCVVKSASGVSVISNAATLTVQAKPASVPVTGVKLNTETLELFTGNTATLTATVQPDDATNKNVTWQSDNANVATVQNGTVNAVGAGEATITVTTEDVKKTATCKVTVTQSEYSISADTTALNFGSAYTGYTQPAAQMVTITNTGNQQVTVTLPTANDFIITAGTGFTNGSAAIEPDGTATFTVQPKAGLAVGTYSENISISGTHDVNATISATFTVKQYSSGGGTPTKTPSQQATDKIESAKEGSTVEITLRTGQTKLDKEVFEELAGRDVTLEISVPGGITWTVNGQDIPENADLTDLDLGVTLDASTIPVSVVNTITGAVDTIQISLKHDGEFGFTMTLSAPLGKTNAGYWANLYWYNERTEELEFQQAARIARDGTAEFALDHASDYAIVIDDRSHEPVDLPFNDVPEGYWAYDAIQYVYGEGLMAGTSGSTFNPEGTTTRGQIVTILWRLSGSPVVNYLMDFDDVDPAAYYAEAIRWATSEGIAGGYGNGSFGPDDPITREQLAVMLHRYAQHQGYDVSIGEDTNILSYADAFTVSEYAVSALQWACGAGIISGTGDGSTLTPQGEATRAQAAVMLMRFCEEYVTW